MSGLVLYVRNARRPFSGRMKVVGRRELVHVDVSVEGTLAAVVSARAVVPDTQRAARLTEQAPRVSPVGATRRRSYGDLQRQALPPRQPR